MPSPINQVLTFVLPKADKIQFDMALGLVADASDIRFLAQDQAFDAFVAPERPEAFLNDLRARLRASDIQADYCLQPVKDRRKKLLICDMDSTLIGQECIDELADFAGVKDRVSAITERAMRGEIGFEGALTERVSLLKNLSLSVLQTCFNERIFLNSGARTLCQTMKADGAKTVIVSGGFTFFTQRVAETCGFDSHQANRLLDENQKLTGKVGMPILGREAKLTALKNHSDEFGGPASAVAIGDGANDLAMITAAGLGIAYRAKPAVAAAAHCAIDHTDLTTALFFQGYRESEFVS